MHAIFQRHPRNPATNPMRQLGRLCYCTRSGWVKSPSAEETAALFARVDMGIATGVLRAYNQSAMRTADYQPVKVLSISPAEHDHTCLQHILDHTSWRLWPTGSIAGAVETVQRHHIPVVVTSEQLPDGNWKDLLRQLQCLPEPPEVIVITANAGDQLWSDVLRSGAYDVIPKPLNKSEVFRVVSLAWRQWRDQWIGKAPVRATCKASA